MNSIPLPNLEQDATVKYSGDKTTITLEVQANKAQEYWIAVGVSSSGNMRDADIYVFDPSDASVKRMYGTKNGETPITHPNPDGFTLLKKEVTGDTVSFSLQIPRVGDLPTQYISDTIEHNLIYAAGPKGNFRYHDGQRGSIFIQFRSDGKVKEELELPKDAKFWEFTQENYIIPKDSDTYWCRHLEIPPGKSVIGFVPEIRTKFVHHYVVYSCYYDEYLQYPSFAPTIQSLIDSPNGWSCGMGKGESYCESPIYVWAPGTKARIYPEDVSYFLTTTHLVLEVHYNNIDNLEGEVDNSGLKIYYVDQPREKNAFLEAAGRGDEPTEPDIFVPAGKRGSFHAYFHLSGCNNALEVRKLNGHMHETGVEAIMSLIRNREKRVLIHRAYDFGYQPYLSINPFILQDDDVLEIECIFDGADRDFDTVGGEATSQEMCLEFIEIVVPMQKLMEGVLNNCEVERSLGTLEQNYEVWKEFDVFVDNPVSGSFYPFQIGMTLLLVFLKVFVM